MRRSLLLSALAAALLAALPRAAPAQEAAAPAAAGPATEMTLGAADAPVTVVEYASFTCPHCAAFHADTFPKLKAEYIDTGKVRFVYREVYFDRFGLWAGMLARCGGDERYFGFTDALYATQKEWIGDGQPQTVADNLRRLGRTAGLTDAEVNACMNDSAAAEALVAAFQANSQADGVNSTPSFVIDGTLHKNLPWDEFRQVLDGKLSEG